MLTESDSLAKAEIVHPRILTFPFTIRPSGMNEPPVIRKSTVDSPYEPCNDKFALNQIDNFSFVAVYFNHMVGI